MLIVAFALEQSAAAVTFAPGVETSQLCQSDLWVVEVDVLGYEVGPVFEAPGGRAESLPSTRIRIKLVATLRPGAPPLPEPLVEVFDVEPETEAAIATMRRRGATRAVLVLARFVAKNHTGFRLFAARRSLFEVRDNSIDGYSKTWSREEFAAKVVAAGCEVLR